MSETLPAELERARALSTDALLTYLVDRYHEGHRRDLPALVATARAVDAAGAAPPVAGDIDAFAQRLDQHLFKEEARLFPMMAQGGNTLIGHLIDDMGAEHVAHAELIEAIRRRLTGLRLPASGEAALTQLQARFEALVAELHRHAQLEDRVLFPRFAPPR